MRGAGAARVGLRAPRGTCARGGTRQGPHGSVPGLAVSCSTGLGTLDEP